MVRSLTIPGCTRGHRTFSRYIGATLFGAKICSSSSSRSFCYFLLQVRDSPPLPTTLLTRLHCSSWSGHDRASFCNVFGHEYHGLFVDRYIWRPTCVTTLLMHDMYQLDASGGLVDTLVVSWARILRGLIRLLSPSCKVFILLVISPTYGISFQFGVWRYLLNLCDNSPFNLYYRRDYWICAQIQLHPRYREPVLINSFCNRSQTVMLGALSQIVVSVLYLCIKLMDTTLSYRA